MNYERHTHRITDPETDREHTVHLDVTKWGVFATIEGDGWDTPDAIGIEVMDGQPRVTIEGEVDHVDEAVMVNVTKSEAEVFTRSAPMTDRELVDELVNFVRTPEWSVSMLEDIAALVHKARPDAEPLDLDRDDPRAWQAH